MLFNSQKQQTQYERGSELSLIVIRTNNMLNWLFTSPNFLCYWLQEAQWDPEWRNIISGSLIYSQIPIMDYCISSGESNKYEYQSNHSFAFFFIIRS